MTQPRLETVADLVAKLLAMPQELPVVVTCHYDNDDGLRGPVGVSTGPIIHSEVEFFTEMDPSEPGTFTAVIVG